MNNRNTFDLERVSVEIIEEENFGEAARDTWHAVRLYGVPIALLLVLVICMEVLAMMAVVRFLRSTSPPAQARTLVVLGSGGHTAEMLKLVDALDKQRYSPRTYVVADTDMMSGRKAAALEEHVQTPGDGSSSGGGGSGAADKPAYDVVAIPRSREVGQSYLTSVWTTIVAFVYACATVLTAKPEVVLLNGPGTCIPIAAATWLFRLLSPLPCKIVYVESIARTRKLSLSGLILYKLRLTDLLLVQWKELQRNYPRAAYEGRLY